MSFRQGFNKHTQCLTKKTHMTKGEAERAASQRESEGGPKLYTYKCPGCPYYHLTKTATIRKLRTVAPKKLSAVAQEGSGAGTTGVHVAGTGD